LADARSFCDVLGSSSSFGARLPVWDLRGHPGTLDSLPGYLLDTAHIEEPWGYAEVACSGRVFVDRRGIRAERAVIMRLARATESWPRPAEADEDALGLGARYGVAVVGLEEVPGWVTANRRPTGGPVEDATGDFESLDLPGIPST
jgi:hypothetical protein